VHKASPDGHTLLLATNTHIINHVLYSKLPFDYTRDFTAIGLTTSAPMMIAVNPDKVKARDLKEFTAMLKAAPGKYSYASCNIASPHHFAMEMYKSTMQLFAVHIPHRGCTPAVTDTVAGHLDIVATSVPAGLPFIKQGRLRAIALDSPGAAAEIQARAAELSLPRQVLDPSFDPSFARLWVASLDDNAIAMVHRVMAEELRRRDGQNPAPRRMAALFGRG
jgi:tripartite-type tricarboxylate transporter receptor subunit TctC